MNATQRKIVQQAKKDISRADTDLPTFVNDIPDHLAMSLAHGGGRIGIAHDGKYVLSLGDPTDITAHRDNSWSSVDINAWPDLQGVSPAAVRQKVLIVTQETVPKMLRQRLEDVAIEF
jgi:glucose/arabinose dehydrogenase